MKDLTNGRYLSILDLHRHLTILLKFFRQVVFFVTGPEVALNSYTFSSPVPSARFPCSRSSGCAAPRCPVAS